MLLFVGLGNPDAEYRGNRHNVGFMAVDEIIHRHSFAGARVRFQGLVAEGRLGTERVMILKPATYMNESGRSVGQAARYFKCPPEDVFVFHDDLDLAPGKVRVKKGGGHAGHNGLRSIDQHIGKEYWRVRIGIGHPGDKNRVHGYVLHDFSKDDTKWLEPLLDAMAGASPLLAAGDESGFMSKISVLTQPRTTKKPKPKAGGTAPATETGKADNKDPENGL